MYQTKKIAVFISHIYGPYQRLLYEGIKSKAREYGYSLEVYTTNDGEDLGEYGLGEETVLKVADFNSLAGAVFASDTYTDTALKEKIGVLLDGKKDFPVVEVTNHGTERLHVALDNNSPIGAITDYIIEKKGFKDICFLSDLKHPFFSDIRENIFLGSLKKHDIPVAGNTVFATDETKDSYREAVSAFLGDGRQKAIVCYNDDTALNLIEAALSMGKRIPEDFLISGCDDLEQGRYLNPALTTVSFPLTEVGSEAMALLFKLINKEPATSATVTAKPIYRESTCDKATDTPNLFDYIRKANSYSSDLEMAMLASVKTSTALSHASDVEAGCDLIYDYITASGVCKEFYLCLYEDWDHISDPFPLGEETDETEESANDSLILKLAVKDGRRLPECSFLRKSLLPEYICVHSDSDYVVTPLFFGTKAFGYVAMSFSDDFYPFKLVQWISDIAQFLQNLCETKRSGMLSERLERVYFTDSLTGLYNRDGFESKYKGFLDLVPGDTKFMSALVFDLDSLKVINDSFGHEAGDFAIKSLGRAISSAITETDLAERYGGDEFFVLLCHDDPGYPDEVEKQACKYLENHNALNQKSYNISASFGHVTVPFKKPVSLEDIRALFTEADKEMYEYKKAKKASLK
ncbi:MAG: GGDEF domain-containing protein [Lachnospiraceae bacterium]|nr:GGDEF domain-containing protein [Lachnospiraceae bacterium]